VPQACQIRPAPDFGDGAPPRRLGWGGVRPRNDWPDHGARQVSITELIDIAAKAIRPIEASAPLSRELKVDEPKQKHRADRDAPGGQERLRTSRSPPAACA
jgi:hypothetical protein